MATLFSVDVGGTFTDVVMVRDGAIHVTKVPSNPTATHLPVIEGARRLGVQDAAVFNHASTKGLNAVLTRTLPKVGFLTTQGHRDMLDAGRCMRPMDNQTDARWHRPFGDAARPLVRRYLRRGIHERILASGAVLLELDEAQARTELEILKRCGIEGLAICLINSFVNPAHEQRLLALTAEIFGAQFPVSASFQVGPRAKEYPRASTTVIDVMMKLIYADYAQVLDSQLRASGFQGKLNFADCTAALIPWREAVKAPHRILFAGPAAGAAACCGLGAAIGDGNLIGCDVGGTSTDVTVIVNGAPFINDSFEIEHDLLVNTLSTEVASVGAGGGSIVSVSPSGDLRVGPHSAGAAPGPACYGRGGSLPTVTDACLLMGILDPQAFADGQIRLDTPAAQRAFESLNCRMSQAERIGFAWKIALNNIAEEVSRCALRHGVDTREFSLMAFGAAGPMLLAGVLDLVKARRLIVPPHPGLFSAIGLLCTDFVYASSRSQYQMLLPDSGPQIEALFAALEAQLRARLGNEEFVVRRSFDGRLAGQSWETPFINVDATALTARGPAALSDEFHAEYARRNGVSFPQIPVQGVTWRVQMIVPTQKLTWQPVPASRGKPTPIAQRVLRHLGPQEISAAVYTRAALGTGDTVTGPALLVEPLATTLVMPGQLAQIGAVGEIVITEAT
ncbi:MAG TPA: hydantoinase/oxoprolinase family protein [Steroidobacteraceae bacterium]|nr:hydantoinase/oxoprolinase family protein [Steroidobacteraceae bacterium]